MRSTGQPLDSHWPHQGAWLASKPKDEPSGVSVPPGEFQAAQGPHFPLDTPAFLPQGHMSGAQKATFSPPAETGWGGPEDTLSSSDMQSRSALQFGQQTNVSPPALRAASQSASPIWPHASNRHWAGSNKPRFCPGMRPWAASPDPPSGLCPRVGKALPKQPQLAAPDPASSSVQLMDWPLRP